MWHLLIWIGAHNVRIKSTSEDELVPEISSSVLCPEAPIMPMFLTDRSVLLSPLKVMT
jgi:hypothetical protein